MDAGKHILGKSKHAEILRKRFRRLAEDRKSCAIIGETGAGKSFLAEELGRTDSKFDIIAADRITETELDERLAVCDAGTLLIDDADGASFRNQYRIARFIDLHSKDIRLIITLSAPPDDLHGRRRLIDELYGKVLTFEQIAILPLRERPEDIPAFVRHFAPDLVLDVNGLELLIRRVWHENIRELRSVIEHCLDASGGGTLRLPAEFVDERPEIARAVSDILSHAQPGLRSSLDGLERGILERALFLCGFDMSKSAKFLGMDEKDFEQMARRHGLTTASSR